MAKPHYITGQLQRQIELQAVDDWQREYLVRLDAVLHWSYQIVATAPGSKYDVTAGRTQYCLFVREQGSTGEWRHLGKPDAYELREATSELIRQADAYVARSKRRHNFTPIYFTPRKQVKGLRYAFDPHYAT